MRVQDFADLQLNILILDAPKLRGNGDDLSLGLRSPQNEQMTDGWGRME